MKNLAATLCLTFAVTLFSAEKGFSEGRWLTAQTKNNPNCFFFTYRPKIKGIATWSGNCLEGRVHGKGTLSHGRTKHVGNFRDGKANGRGSVTLPIKGLASAFNYKKFDGTFKNGALHGRATMTYRLAKANKNLRSVGEWKDGQKHGRFAIKFIPFLENAQEETWVEGVRKFNKKWLPIMKNPNCLVWSGRSQLKGPETWSGTCVGGKAHGKGTLTYLNADKFVGNLREGKNYGQGTFTWTNGKYIGEWKDGNQHGQGTITSMADGKKRVSNYQHGVLHGQVTVTDPYNKEVTKEIWEKGVFINYKIPIEGFPPCSKKRRRHNCVGKKSYMNSVYIGEWINDKPSGKGTHIGKFGKYVGDLINDKYHGQGTLTLTNGEKYIGEWKDGKKHGQGTLTLANGGKYIGEWKDGKKHGQGTTTWVDGNKFIGEYSGGEKRFGKFTNPSNGQTYFGQWSHNKKHGYGMITLANGDKYAGRWKWDKKEGRGTVTYANGEKWIGTWDTGSRTIGEGAHTYANGDKYIGKWKNGKKHGQGTITYTNGEKWIGTWDTDSKTTGEGAHTYANGDKYIGKWKNGKKHGQGTITYTNGEKWIGTWDTDSGSTGEGVYTYTNGHKYIGNLKNGERIGEGAYHFSDGVIWLGEWKGGEGVGQFTKISAGGHKSKGIIINGNFIETKDSIAPGTTRAATKTINILNGYYKLYHYLDLCHGTNLISNQTIKSVQKDINASANILFERHNIPKKEHDKIKNLSWDSSLQEFDNDPINQVLKASGFGQRMALSAKQRRELKQNCSKVAQTMRLMANALRSSHQSRTGQGASRKKRNF